MEQSNSTYMPRLVEDYKPISDSPRGIPDEGVDTWFMTQPNFYENRHFPSLNLMTDNGVVECLLWQNQVTDLIGPIHLSMDDLSRLSSARKAQLE